MAKIMKIKSIIISSVAIIAFSSFVLAQDVKMTESQDAVKQERGQGKRSGEGKHGRHGKDKMMRGLHRLNLSDTQKEQIKSLRERNKTQFQPQHDEMKTLMSKKRDGIITNEEQSRLKELKTQMRENGQKMNEEMLSILTPEQKTQMEQMKVEMREKMKARRGSRGEKGDKTLVTPQDN
jgi:periplasmic protein CpxP/Spy